MSQDEIKFCTLTLEELLDFEIPVVWHENEYVYYFFINTNGYRYQIEKSSIKNHADLVRWIGHLLPKNWIDKESIKQLIMIVTKNLNPK